MHKKRLAFNNLKTKFCCLVKYVTPPSISRRFPTSVPATYKADAHRKLNEETTSTCWITNLYAPLVNANNCDTQRLFGFLRICTLR